MSRLLNLARAEMFLFPLVSRPALWPTQPSVQWASGLFTRGLKQLVHDTEHLFTSGGKVTNA